MGHERLGVLPKTKPWKRIAQQIEAYWEGAVSAAEIASTTLSNVERRYAAIHKDRGVQAAFRFLCALSLGQDALRAEAGIDLGENPSPLALASAMGDRVRSSGGAQEYGGIAERAASDAIGWWIASHGGPGLFGESTARETWASASTGAGFSELSHTFFAKFTERYLNYFIDRVASRRASSLLDRERLADEIAAHADDIATHALETAKITQSLAAGWYNKHLARGHPDLSKAERFLALSFGKLRDELVREAGLHGST